MTLWCHSSKVCIPFEKEDLSFDPIDCLPNISYLWFYWRPLKKDFLLHGEELVWRWHDKIKYGLCFGVFNLSSHFLSWSKITIKLLRSEKYSFSFIPSFKQTIAQCSASECRVVWVLAILNKTFSLNRTNLIPVEPWISLWLSGLKHSGSNGVFLTKGHVGWNPTEEYMYFL